MRKIHIMLTISLLLIIFIRAGAQPDTPEMKLSGSWMGSIKTGALSLRIVFNLKYHESDSLSATMDSPDQGAKDIPMGKVIVRNDSLRIDAPLILGKYEGRIMNDSLVEGTWKQRGYSAPLNISRLKEGFALNRPQEPRPPFPYIIEDVRFFNSRYNINLAGTITIPAGEGPFPAVILITGSGAQDRDESIMGHKPFHVIADYLTRNGIAVLRYDDRGVGKSEGNYAAATTIDLASDAEAAFMFLKKDPRINARLIGLAGHSEGGIIAPIAAASNREIAFIVSLAGTGVRGEEIIIRQQTDIGIVSGVSADQLKEGIETNRRLFSVLKKEKDDNKAEAKITEAYDEILKQQNLSTEEREKAVRDLKSGFPVSSYHWLRAFLVTDPSVYWKKVRCPVLALNGEKDLQVAADINLQAIEKALKTGRNSNYKTIKLEGLNHLFQRCSTGLPSEYGTIEETFSPEVLEIISDWIRDLKVSP